MKDSMAPPGESVCLTPREVEEAIARNLPAVDHHGEAVEAVGTDSIRVRLPFKSKFMGTERWGSGSGTVFSGPTMMGLADTAMYGCVLGSMGGGVIPVMVNLAITFIRPAPAVELVADARIVRRGARLFYLECWLNAAGEQVAHITSTYRVAAVPAAE